MHAIQKISFHWIDKQCWNHTYLLFCNVLLWTSWLMISCEERSLHHHMLQLVSHVCSMRKTMVVIIMMMTMMISPSSSRFAINIIIISIDYYNIMLLLEVFTVIMFWMRYVTNNHLTNNHLSNTTIDNNTIECITECGRSTTIPPKWSASTKISSW